MQTLGQRKEKKGFLKSLLDGESENLTLGAKGVQKILGYTAMQRQAPQERQEGKVVELAFMGKSTWSEWRSAWGVDQKPSGNLQVRIKDRKDKSDIIMGAHCNTPNQK